MISLSWERVSTTALLMVLDLLPGKHGSPGRTQL